jgi:DNA repair exonuclease SbcCD ATPase subunit
MIRFKTVKWKNFLSTGAQFTEVKLDKATTTLVVGENGAGKSTVLDAICFCLFNKPFRSINKPQLMNSINGKALEVEIEFNIGQKDYKVRRGIKPGIFEIYVQGILLNQDAASKDYQKYLEDAVLKLNYKSFTQIVILGSASFTPFMQLPLGHRREIIEDILDIQIFTTMNSVLKDKNTEMKATLLDLDSKIELGKNKVKLQQQYIETLEKDKQRKVEDVQKRILESTAEISQLNAGCDAEKENERLLKSEISDSAEKRNKRTEMGSLLRKLSERIKAQESSIQFYHEHDVCPTCSQNLDEDLKTSAVTQHTHKLEEVETAIQTLTEQLNDVDTRLDEIADIEQKITEHQSNIIQFNTKIIAAQSYIKKLQEDLNTNTTVESNLADEKTTLKTLAKEVVALADTKTKINEEKHYLDIASILLKDTGIKTKIIRQYLPVINKLVNKYLQAMDFFCHFELDETFNESIKSRHRDEFSYSSFSEGEKQRIDLALLFTWRTIAKMKNCASTNLLLLDEVFDSSLDANGTDYVMNLINTLGDETNVFVISHKGDLLFDKFRSVIKFEKHQNFSRIQGI